MTKQDLWKQAVDFIESQKPILLKKSKNIKHIQQDLKQKTFYKKQELSHLKRQKKRSKSAVKTAEILNVPCANAQTFKKFSGENSKADFISLI
ncbi:MAG: hypothetical protein PWQ16_809 [bacterium]|nr:hypothetical protein [bacterium]